VSAVADPPRPSARPRTVGSGRRISTSVQVPFIHERRGAQHHLEALAIFVIFGLAFGALGYWLVVDMQVVTFTSLDRLTGAYLAWHGSPAKLAAIGFSFAPLQTLTLLPLTLFASLATNLVALPVCSAVFGGLTMVSINRVLERCDLAAILRYPMLVLIAVTPTIAFYAASGSAVMIGIYPLTAAVSALIAWYRTADTRYLIAAGGAFAFAVMANYGDALWLLLGAAMVSQVLARHGADDAEIEGSAITYLTPALYAVGLWCLCNWLIVDSPLGWFTNGSGTNVNVIHNVAHSAPFGTIFLQCFKLAFAASPMILIVAPALIAVAFSQRNELAGWLAAFCILAILEPGVDALLRGNIATMQLSTAAPQVIISVIGAAWLYHSLESSRALVGIGLVVAQLAAIALIWHAMDTYPYQDMEQAFHKVVATKGASVPATSLGGLAVGIRQEQQMSSFIREHVDTPNSILTDNSQSYGVILLTAEPKLFRTRLEKGNWFHDVAKPPHSVKYFLITRFNRQDAINAAYPGAALGQRSGLTIVFRNARYALLAVAPGTNEKNSVRHRTGNGPGPGLVTPAGL
jgi:hypothetical protein